MKRGPLGRHCPAPELGSEPPARERPEITNLVQDGEAFQIPAQVAVPVEERVGHDS